MCFAPSPEVPTACWHGLFAGLAVRAIIGAATGDADALDPGAAHQAWLALAAKQPRMVEIAVAVVSVIDEAWI